MFMLALFAVAAAANPLYTHAALDLSQSTSSLPTYTALHAYLNCQAAAAGEYVAWSDVESGTHGLLSANDLLKQDETPLRDLVKGPAYCCRSDPFVSLLC